VEFLDNFILPQSAEHIELLHYMLIVILFIFIPFAGILLGGSILSLIGFKKSGKTKDNKFYQLAKDVIQIVTFNKSAGIIFGIIPIAAIIIIYAQLLHNAEILIFRYFGWAFILITISLAFIYIYRTFIVAESKSFRAGLAAIAGVIFLTLGLWFLTAGITIPTLYSEWQAADFISGLFLWQVLSRFIYFILFAFALTGGIILFSLFEVRADKEKQESDYKKFFRNHILVVTFASAILIPVFALINLFALPDSSLSGSVFTYAVISLLLLFLGYHFLYLLTKEIKGTIAALLFFSLVFSIAANILAEQKALKNSTRVQSVILSNQFEEYITELRGENVVPELNAAEIYQVRCASCHRFDEKLVGPPHKDVLPKYVGKEAQLIAFIRNPVKVDPEYPPMPNPGLKPNEAEAVAKYLLETYESKNR
jgi:cytochrome c